MPTDCRAPIPRREGVAPAEPPVLRTDATMNRIRQ